MDISELAESVYRVPLLVGALVPLDRFRQIGTFLIARSVSEPPCERGLCPVKPCIRRASQIVDRLRVVAGKPTPPGIDAVGKLRHGDEFAAIRRPAQEIDCLDSIERAAKFAADVSGSSQS